jgi:hypothetical protein
MVAKDCRERSAVDSTRLSEIPYSPRGCNLFIADGYFLLCAASARLTEPHSTSTVQRAQVFPKFRCWLPRPPRWEIDEQATTQTTNTLYTISGDATTPFLYRDGSSSSVSWPKCPHLDLQATRTTLILMGRVTYRKPSAPA